MKQQSAYIPVPCSERMPSRIEGVTNWHFVFNANEQVEIGMVMPDIKFKTWDNDFNPTHWLEKKEDVFVLTKEELRDFAEKARQYTLNNAQHVGSAVYVMGSTDDFFDDFFNQ